MLQVRTAQDFAAEKTYICSVLLGELLGIPYQLHFEDGQDHYLLQIPNGAAVVVEDHFFRKQKPESYLRASNIPNKVFRLPNPYISNEDLIGIFGLPNFTKQDKQIDCGLDIFASAYFMLTRWEEYACEKRDELGRFPAEQSLAHRFEFSDRPIVNEYADFLWQMLSQLGWTQPRKKHSFQLHLSHDVDHPRLWWSGADRLRTMGGSILRRRNIREAAWWFNYQRKSTLDPYDIFDMWMDKYEEKGLIAHFNFMGDRPKTYDCFYPLQHPFVLNLIKKISDRGHKIGFHPSREAHLDAELFRKELATLQAVSPQAVKTGRQHYLYFSAPETWQNWFDAGMEWDSSLAYPEAEGFRCGTCHDFPVFNFLSRKTLPLREKPLLAMDVSLVLYQKYAPAMAAERLNLLKAQVEKHHGEFVLLWHNSSWNTCFWAPWQKVYLDFIASF